MRLCALEGSGEGKIHICVYRDIATVQYRGLYMLELHDNSKMIDLKTRCDVFFKVE